MKKSDISQIKKGSDVPKHLYRSISDQAKNLDDARSCARNIQDLFAPNLLCRRRKFGDYCERLIFSEPLLYGKKAEELLWRKVYYDVITTAKKLKINEFSSDDIVNIESHLNAGVGFYHHFLMKLQYEFNLNIGDVVDFSLTNVKPTSSNDVNVEAVDWAKQAVHQCLIYLGDLNRYRLEIYPKLDPNLAVRYYLQAISYRPEYGIPHNQMGTLAMNQNRYLEAVYHYLGCLSCKFPFEGSVNNLISLFEKNSKFIEQLPKEDQNADCIIEPDRSEIIKRFFARFLLLTDIWYFDKKVTKVYHLCHQTYKNLEECLSFNKSVSSESGASNPTDVESIETEFLNNENIFKIITICLLCIFKLQSTDSRHLSTAVAFTLAAYSQLIQDVTNHIEESILNYPLNQHVKHRKSSGILRNIMGLKSKRSKSKLRRRKAVKVDSEEESDNENNQNDYSSSDDSFMSDEEDMLVLSSDEEESDIIKVSDESNCGTPKQQNGLTNGINTLEQCFSKNGEDLIKKVQLIDPNDMLEIITEETTLQSIKIINDWLQSDPEVLKSCGSNTKSLFKQITNLHNLININVSNKTLIGVDFKINEIMNKVNAIPLTEDVSLKDVAILKKSQESLDWDLYMNRDMSLKEEAFIRVMKLLSFGKFLTTFEETGVTYDEEHNVFVCKINDDCNVKDVNLSIALMDEMELQESKGDNAKTENNVEKSKTSGGQLNKMKHMGQLWLAAEVRALESRVCSKSALSPYLVLDADALIKYTFMVKNLVNSRKFIVLVPTAVVSALDDLKREKLEAREAIRWLESQFHRGNRFFRAQRPQERAPIPFIKYPKKKDKEMHVYIQIIECCYFLAEQQKGASNLVTLLIGNQNVLSNGENKEFSYMGLAQSVGITLESITTFYGKWKKSKGKR